MIVCADALRCRPRWYRATESTTNFLPDSERPWVSACCKIWFPKDDWFNKSVNFSGVNRQNVPYRDNTKYISTTVFYLMSLVETWNKPCNVLFYVLQSTFYIIILVADKSCQNHLTKTQFLSRCTRYTNVGNSAGSSALELILLT